MTKPSIDALLEQLGAATVSQRDLATQALLRADKLARASLRGLLAAEIDGSQRARAAFTLAGLRPVEQGELLATGGPRMRGSFRGSLERVVAEVSAQTGCRLVCGDADPDKRVSFDAADLGTLATLDALALAADASWEPTADGAARLCSTPAVRCPTCYVGPFRVRVTSLAALRTNDYRTARAAATLGLEVTGLTLLSSIGGPALHDLDAIDDTGARHQLTVSTSDVSGIVPQSAPPDLPPIERWTDILTRRLIAPLECFSAKTELPLRASSIKRLRGQFTYLHSGSYTDVVVGRLAKGQRIELDNGIVLWVDSLSDYDCTLSITTPAWGKSDAGVLATQPISTVALGIDQNGREGLATITRWTTTDMTNKSRGERCISVQLNLDSHEHAPLHSLRLRLVSDIRSTPVPFEFSELALP